MKKSLLLTITVLLVVCAGCTTSVPTPVDTVEPTVTAKNTAEVKTLTPTTAIVAATSTATQIPTSTITSTQWPTEPPRPQQGKYDFSKYGPLAYINVTLELMTIQFVNPDGTRSGTFEPDRYYEINEIGWSPDGTQLVLATSIDGINLLSVAEKRLTNLSSTNEFLIILSPSFSQDGKFITFFSNNQGAIYRMNSDGSGQVNLTPDAHYRNAFYSPAWAPSGKQIVYILDADGSIYRINADGSATQKLVGIGWNEQPRYSPDGRWLAFIRNDDDSQGFLYAMPLAGGSYRALSSNQHNVESFSWSPDGRYLVFRSYICNNDGCDYEWWMVEFETGEAWEFKIARPAHGWIKGGLVWSPIMKTANTRQDCTEGWTQLAIGNLVQLIGNVPNRVRSEPQKGENVVGQFVADETFILLDGPVCAEGLVWWEIADPRLPGGSGWTAEGDGQEYWLELVTSATCVTFTLKTTS